MQKPEPKHPYPPLLHWREVHAYIEHLTGRDIHDWKNTHGSNNHYRQWCDSKGYGVKDSDGDDRGTSKTWYAEYTTDPDGQAAQPEYCNYWHWILDVCCVSNGATCYLPVIEAEDDRIIGAPDWAKEICELIAKEFPEYIEHGAIRMFVDW